MLMRILNPGTLFAGRYQIVACIAHGGMGTVYEAIHSETGRRCALKIMLPEMVQSAELRERFRLEARVAVRIESEFVVDVLDAGIDETGQMPFLVMEFLRGEELHSLLKRAGRLSAGDVILYLEQAASALDKAHKAMIVHRDLKPGNLFVTRREDGTSRIKLLDFGIAKLVAETATGAPATRSIGTPMYMAPEQYQLHHLVTPATDIYALGMLAFTMLVGKPYWSDESEAGANVFSFAAVAMHGPKEKASLRAWRRGVKLPESFDFWFAKITSVVPAQRYASAGEAVQALKEALLRGDPARTAVMDIPAPVSQGMSQGMRGTYRMLPQPVSSPPMIADDEENIATRALPLDFLPNMRGSSPELPFLPEPAQTAPLQTPESPPPIENKTPLETTVSKHLPDILEAVPQASNKKQRRLATFAFLGSALSVLGVALGASFLIPAAENPVLERGVVPEKGSAIPALTAPPVQSSAPQSATAAPSATATVIATAAPAPTFTAIPGPLAPSLIIREDPYADELPKASSTKAEQEDDPYSDSPPIKPPRVSPPPPPITTSAGGATPRKAGPAKPAGGKPSKWIDD